MDESPELSGTNHKPSTPPPPPPPPPPPQFWKLGATAANEEEHRFQPTIDINSELESTNKKDKENDEESSSWTLSSSSSDSESDFFQINPPELSYPPPSPNTGVNLNTDGTEKISNPNSEKSSGLAIERRSPVVQSMTRDPNRIPSSIFSRSPVTPMEWSVASNESLFSIHMGDTSFSRDQIFSTGRSGELRGFASCTIDRPSPWISPDLWSVAAVGGVGRREMGDLVVEMDEAAAASANAEAMLEVMRAAAEGRESQKKVMLGRSISRHSDGSTASFAFPILTGDGRVGSIKMNFEHQQLNPQIRPSKILSNRTPTAAIWPRQPAHSHTPAFAPSKWFSCEASFSCLPCRKFRCC